MIYLSSSELINTLRNLPETGMGYQIIDARKANEYSKHRYVVYNGQFIIDDDYSLPIYKKQLFEYERPQMRASAKVLNFFDINVLSRKQLPTEFTERFRTRMYMEGKNLNSKGAIDNPKIYANGTDVYVRLSHYQDDIRIDKVNKKLKPGSFSTTYEDYIYCKTNNCDPVDRYALPSDDAINWAFHIRPKSYDQLQIGIVQPANNKVGGGVEAYFENGTSNDTFFKEEPY